MMMAMWPRRETPEELSAAVEYLRGIAQILMESDAKLEQIVALMKDEEQ